jgi:hypothetical protein
VEVIRFKDGNGDRLRNELFYGIDLRLQAVLQHLAMVFWLQHGKALVMTSGIRTPGENEAVGSTGRSHVEARAVDIRTRDPWTAKPYLSNDEINWLLEFVTFVWGEYVYIRYHVGTAPHVHISVNRNFARQECLGSFINR